jgi:hypothetical protein
MMSGGNMARVQRSRSLLAVLLYCLTAALVLAWFPKARGVGEDERAGLSWPRGVPMTSANLRRILPAKGFLKDGNDFMLPRCSLRDLCTFLDCTEDPFRPLANLAPPGSPSAEDQDHAWFAKNDFLCLIHYLDPPTPNPNERPHEFVRVTIVLDYVPPRPRR